jgi:hypothetical protein
MITYLKDRSYYADLYDHATVGQCRSGEELVNASFRKIEETVPISELQERTTAWYVEYSKLYFQLVELLSVGRQYYREAEIDELMKHDKQKDQRLADAHLVKMPLCRNCGRNMVVINKYYLRRDNRRGVSTEYASASPNLARKVACSAKVQSKKW